MNKSLMKMNLMMKVISDMLVYLPSPVNISILWNFGSLLGICLIMQVITGLFLSMHYVSNVDYSFYSIINIMNNINNGWLIRLMHMNGASLFFVCIYMHIGRGMYYQSYKLIYVWVIGVMILLLLMMTAFMGYVLPWGQMSFWGATVITNLMSALPYVGSMLVEWVWGGFSVDNSTLNRFYSLHFLIPFILLFIVLVHLIYLHENGSNNPLGLNSNFYKIIFHSYYSLKDIMGILILLILLFYIILEYPNILGDSENFIEANSMITPIHIQPEWYFLFAYTILRSIPNKLMGVIMLMMSIMILLFMPYFLSSNIYQSLMFYPLNQMIFWFYVNMMIMLTWLGMQLVEYPYVIMSQIYMMMYFMYYLIDYYIKLFWDKIF